MTQATTPLAASIAGDLIVYLVCPLLVLAIAGVVAWSIRINRRLNTQDSALALIVAQVLPQGQPSLRDIVNTHAVDLARIQGQLTPPTLRPRSTP